MVMTETKYLPEGGLIGTEENRMWTSDFHHLERAMEQGITVEGVAVKCESIDLTLYVDFGGIRGYIPREEAVFLREGETFKDIAVISRVGKPVACKVIGIDRRGSEPLAVLSRKAAQEECEESFIGRLIPGDIIRGTVTHLEPFGAFVDIGCGLVSLMTVDCISVSRIFHPSERFRVGDSIYCVIKSVDGETGRIYLTHKELLGTWQENARKFKVGETVTGIVRSVEEYGVFVELAPNLAGLAELKDGVETGDECAVYIKSIIPEKMKIKLILIDYVFSDRIEREREYYTDVENVEHIDCWTYSPPECSRVVESVFRRGGI